MCDDADTAWKPKLESRFSGCVQIAEVENPHGQGYYGIFALGTHARLVGVKGPDGACWVANPEYIFRSSRLMERLLEVGEHKSLPRKRLLVPGESTRKQLKE